MRDTSTIRLLLSFSSKATKIVFRKYRGPKPNGSIGEMWPLHILSPSALPTRIWLNRSPVAGRHCAPSARLKGQHQGLGHFFQLRDLKEQRVPRGSRKARTAHHWRGTWMGLASGDAERTLKLHWLLKTDASRKRKALSQTPRAFRSTEMNPWCPFVEML